MEEEELEKDKNDAEKLVGPNDVVARALDGTRLYLYNHQAGGHTAFLRTGGDSVCKPVVALELQFYEALATQFPQLQPFVPQFLGKVKSSLTPLTEPLTTPKKMRKGSLGKKRRLGKCNAPTSQGGYSAKLWQQERAKKNKRKSDNGVSLTRANSGGMKDYLVLGDLTRNFRRPCVLDINMGTRQHGEDAPPAKVISHTAKSTTNDGTYTIWDKTWGRQLKPDDIEPAVSTYLRSSSALRWDALEELLTKTRQLKTTMAETTGLRCWGSSLFFIYEGDQSYRPPNALNLAHCQMSSSLDTPDEGMLLGLSNIASRKPKDEEAEQDGQS